MAEGTNQNQNEPDGSNANPNPDGSGTPGGVKTKTYTEEEYKSVVSESIGRRKEIDELKAKLKAIEDEKLTESEKKEKELKETKAKLESLEGSIKQREIDNLILKAMAGKNFVDNEAVELLIKKELESAEDIKAETVTKIVDKLIKDRPQLISSNSSANPSSGNFGKQDKSPADSANDLWKKFLKG